MMMIIESYFETKKIERKKGRDKNYQMYIGSNQKQNKTKTD